MNQELLERMIVTVLYIIPFGLIMLHLWQFTEGQDPEEEDKE
jgi:hypothetical protein